MVRNFEGGFHEGRNCVPCILFCGQDGYLKGCTTEGVAGDAKELKILNRTIEIEVPNGEMTLEVDTKLGEDALETMKLLLVQKTSLRHVSVGMKNEQHRSIIPRNSRQQSRLRTAA